MVIMRRDCADVTESFAVMIRLNEDLLKAKIPRSFGARDFCRPL